MGLRARLTGLLSPPLDAYETTCAPELLAVDLGCGKRKRPGTIGLDLEPADGVDHVVDFTCDALPFGDGAVGFVFSSHSLEHLEDPIHLLREITRVAADGARFELWTPYAWHNTAVFPDHKTHWTHEFYRHVGLTQWPHWTRKLGARWHIDEFVFVIEPALQQELRSRGFSPQFAVDHLNNVVAELGVRGWIDKQDAGGPPTEPRRCYAGSRADSLCARYPLDGGPMAPWGAQLRLWAQRTAGRLRRS